MDDLANWRDRIDDIDEKLVKLLNERAQFAIEIGKIKKKNGIDIFNPAREDSIMEHISHINKGPLETEAVNRIIKQIITECKKIEEE